MNNFAPINNIYFSVKKNISRVNEKMNEYLVYHFGPYSLSAVAQWCKFHPSDFIKGLSFSPSVIHFHKFV